RRATASVDCAMHGNLPAEAATPARRTILPKSRLPARHCANCLTSSRLRAYAGAGQRGRAQRASWRYTRANSVFLVETSDGCADFGPRGHLGIRVQRGAELLVGRIVPDLAQGLLGRIAQRVVPRCENGAMQQGSARPLAVKYIAAHRRRHKDHGLLSALRVRLSPGSVAPEALKTMPRETASSVAALR